MSQVILISDSDTPLGKALVNRYLEKEYMVSALRSSPAGRDDGQLQEGETHLVVHWNRKSPISARNVILKTLNHLDRIDQALILQTPQLERKLLQELTFSVIERAVDNWIKGSLFIIKEILDNYSSNQRGSLALINYTQLESGGLFPPLESVLRGSFQALANSLFAGSTLKNVRINGFESFSSQADAFADFIVSTMSERAPRSSGKLFRFQEKSGLFSFK